MAAVSASLVKCALSSFSFLLTGMWVGMLWRELEDAVPVRLSNRIKGDWVSNIMEGQSNPALFYLACTLTEKAISTF